MNEFVETLLDLHVARAEERRTTSSSSAAAVTVWRPRTTSPLGYGITNVAVARIELHRLGQLRPQHHDHPCQLRHPRIDPLLPAQPRALQHAWKKRPAAGSCTATKGLLWLAHTEIRDAGRAGALHAQQRRAAQRPSWSHPTEAKTICPELDLSGGGRYPVLGAHHITPAQRPPVTTASCGPTPRARCARACTSLQNTKVTGLIKRWRARDRVCRPTSGNISAGIVMSAVGGNVTTIANIRRTYVCRCERIRCRPSSRTATRRASDRSSATPSCSATCRRPHAARC